MSSDAIIAIETTSMHVDDDPRNITSLSFNQVSKALFIKCKLQIMLVLANQESKSYYCKICNMIYKLQLYFQTFDSETQTEECVGCKCLSTKKKAEEQFEDGNV